MRASFFEKRFVVYPDLPEPARFPFVVPIGFRGSVATFDLSFAPSSEFEEDAEFLSHLQFGEIASGASDFLIHPFIAPLETEKLDLTAADVLAGLRLKSFQSDHIPTLDARSLPYAGYKPRTLNDEIHTDFHNSYMFDNDCLPTDGEHGKVLKRVCGDSLWYVLIHIEPYRYWNGVPVSEFVFLFAVGRSKKGPHLIGAVTTQICHNLCD